jgi:hypothetical protein
MFLGLILLLFAVRPGASPVGAKQIRLSADNRDPDAARWNDEAIGVEPGQNIGSVGTPRVPRTVSSSRAGRAPALRRPMIWQNKANRHPSFAAALQDRRRSSAILRPRVLAKRTNLDFLSEINTDSPARQQVRSQFYKAN